MARRNHNGSPLPPIKSMETRGDKPPCAPTTPPKTISQGEHVKRKIEQRRQNLTELGMLKQIERAEDLDRQTKEILAKCGSQDWLKDTDLNIMVYELEDLEWRVFEVVYIIKPDYKDYSMLIPETDRPVLDSSYKLLRRLAKMDGYSQLKVRTITDLPRPCYLPGPIKGHLWQNPAPKPSCATSLKQSRLPRLSVKGAAVKGSHIPPEIHNLIRRLHKAYAKLCTAVDQWFRPGTVEEYVKRATAKETITHPTVKESVTQSAAMETTTQTSTQTTCPQPAPRRIRVPLPSPRPRLIHINRYNKVASSGYGKSKRKGKTATEDLKKQAKKVLPKPESLDWLQAMDLNMLAYEMEDLEWRVFEVIYVIKPDYKDYSMLIPETDRPVLTDGYNLLKRLAKIDGYSQLNVRPITDLPRPSYLPRPIQGYIGPSPVPKPSSGSFKQSRLPLPYKCEESKVLQSHISSEIHDLIRRVHKAYGILCTMVDQWLSPGTVMGNFTQATVREIPVHQTVEERVTQATDEDIVTQASNKEYVTQATAKDSTSQQAAKEICPRPTPRRIRAPLPSPRPRLIHNNRFSKVASSGYGRCKQQPKPPCATQTSNSCESTRNNAAPCPIGQKYQTLAKEDPPPQPKVEIRTVARLNGSRLPIPVKLSPLNPNPTKAPESEHQPPPADITGNTTKRHSQPQASAARQIHPSCKSVASLECKANIHSIAKQNGSELPISSPVAIKTESNPLTSSASSKNCVAPRPDIRDLAKQNGSKLPVPSMLSTTSRDDSMQPKMLVQSYLLVQPESAVQPESPVQPKPTDQPRSESPIEPKSTPQPRPESDVQRESLVQPKPTGQPKLPTETKPQIQLKSPKQPKSPNQLSLCPRPPSTPLPESGRRRIRVMTPSSDPDKPCPIKPARGILKTVCERMDFREMDAMFEATNHPDDYPPICRNLDRFFYGLMAPRRLVPMGLESWTVLNRRKVQFDLESNDQFDSKPTGLCGRDLEDEEFLELERQCNAKFENEGLVHRES